MEGYAGPASLVRQALAIPVLRRRLALDLTGDDILNDFARLARAACAGDAQARELIERSARYLGHAALTMAALFDLDTVVLAGPSFSVAVSLYQRIIQEEVNHRTFARRAHAVRVVPSVSGSDAAAIGGAVLVLQGELTAGGRAVTTRRRAGSE